MTFSRYGSSNRRKFNSEIAIHFPGRKGLNQPVVLLCPELLVCPHCGFTEFTVPDKELKVLVEGKPVRDRVKDRFDKEGGLIATVRFFFAYLAC
jgi:hypothetical protein